MEVSCLSKVNEPPPRGFRRVPVDMIAIDNGWSTSLEVEREPDALDGGGVQLKSEFQFWFERFRIGLA